MANNHGGKLRPSLRRPANRAPCGDLGGTPGLTSPPRLALCVPAEAQARRPPPAPGRPGGWGAPGGSRAPWLPSSERGRPRTPADTTKPGPDCPSQTTPTRDRYGRAPRARAPRPDGLGTRGGYPGPRVPQGCRGAPVPGTKTPRRSSPPPPPYTWAAGGGQLPDATDGALQGASPPTERAELPRGRYLAPRVPQGCRTRLVSGIRTPPTGLDRPQPPSLGWRRPTPRLATARPPRARSPPPRTGRTRGGLRAPGVPQGCRGGPVSGMKTPPTEFAPLLQELVVEAGQVIGATARPPLGRRPRPNGPSSTVQGTG